MERISADLKPLKKILTDEEFFYQIPNYQRPYSWDKENISALVDDLTKAFIRKDDAEYFCGSLVIVLNAADKRFDIIDGQQRLTTFTILACVIRDLYQEQLQPRARDLIACSIRDKYVESNHRLRVLTEDKSQVDYVNEIINGIRFRDVKNIENTISSKYLQNAYYIRLFLREKLAEVEISIDEFVIWMYEKIVLTVITTKDIGNAINIFNVLNDRGMPLSPMDILKAKMMYSLGDEDRKAFKNRWDSINGKFLQTDTVSFEDMLNTYLYYKLSSNPAKRLDEELLDIFKQEKLDSLAAIYEIDKFSQAYLAAIDEDEKHIYLLRYLQHRIYWHAIVASARFIDYQDQDGLKRILVAFYYQNWIAGATVARIKQTSFNILKAVKDRLDISQVKSVCWENLKNYGTTETFKEDLGGSYIYDRKWTRPVLLLLEYFHLDDSKLNFIPLVPQLQIEHILPQTSDNECADWQNLFSADEREKHTNSLGNLTLLSQRKNVQASNYSFADKKVDYARTDGVATSFEITRQLLAYDEWTMARLQERKEALTKKVLERLDLFK